MELFCLKWRFFFYHFEEKIQLFLSKSMVFDEIVLLAFFDFFWKDKKLSFAVHFRSKRPWHKFSMKTIYKPTTFCGEGFLGLDSIQLLQNLQNIYFSCSLLNYKICVFFTPNTSSKMELSIVYSFSSIKLKFVLKQKPFGKILRFL